MSSNIPDVSDVRSDDLPVAFGDTFNPPGLTNFLGTVQVDRDITGIRNLRFPPIFSGGIAGRYGGEEVCGCLYVDGEYVAGLAGTITFAWQPDRAERTTEVLGLHLKSVTVMPPGLSAALVRLEVFNASGVRRDVRLRFALRAVVRESYELGRNPGDGESELTADAGRGLVFNRDVASGACGVYGLVPPASDVNAQAISADIPLEAGERSTLTFVAALGATEADALDAYQAVAANTEAQVTSAREMWSAELQAAFTPDNDRWSGHLPKLDTDDADIQRLYWTGALGIIYFKRESPSNVFGRGYDTLMPRYWPTMNYLWDYSLSSVAHAMLDPAPMKRYMQHWMQADIHTCHSTSWLTGNGYGSWYAVNDYALVRLMRDYVKFTGDAAWLSESQSGRGGRTARVADHAVDHASYWRELSTDGGPADFGGIDNLLEAVSTYVHQVAGPNAGSVFAMRAAADMIEIVDGAGAGDVLRAGAAQLAGHVNELYATGRGFWSARQPDGSLVDVRSCYDLLTVLYAMAGDISEAQRGEIVTYFVSELRTDKWMRALSNHDLDAPFSIRADHQWTGAFAAWPSEMASGLYGIGEVEETFKWVKSMAATANQGPFGQAHFIEKAIPAHSGGARKSPPEAPHITDWACAAGGSWVRLIVEGIFGVKAEFERISATPAFGPFDPDARLVDLGYQGGLYTVDRTGITQSSGT